MRMLSVGYLSVDCLSLMIVAHRGGGSTPNPCAELLLTS
jgi:hypothetical protein